MPICQNARYGRSGVSAVELAVCLPVIVLIVFASIEACSMIFLQQAIQTVAYETARFAVAARSTTAAALDRGEQVLADRRVSGGAINITPADVTSAARGEHIVVSVSAPLNSNRVMPDFFYGNQQLQTQVTMMRE
jgi:Flp pilus assembly protein TadG